MCSFYFQAEIVWDVIIAIVLHRIVLSGYFLPIFAYSKLQHKCTVSWKVLYPETQHLGTSYDNPVSKCFEPGYRIPPVVYPYFQHLGTVCLPLSIYESRSRVPYIAVVDSRMEACGTIVSSWMSDCSWVYIFPLYFLGKRMKGIIILQTDIGDDGPPPIRTLIILGWHMLSIPHFISNGIVNINTKTLVHVHFLVYLLIYSMVSSPLPSPYLVASNHLDVEQYKNHGKTNGWKKGRDLLAVYLLWRSLFATKREGNAINIREGTDRSAPSGNYRAKNQSKGNTEEHNSRSKPTETI